MKLGKYNNKLVKIIDVLGDEYEGICIYNNYEYNEHEFGRREDSLELLYYIFFKSNIKKIEILNGFSHSYSKLEEMIFNDGIEGISEVLDLEENEHIYRLLKYINKHFNKFDSKKGLIELLTNFLKYCKDKKINNEINIILNKYN